MPYVRRAIIEEHCSKLREVILLHSGGWNDTRSLDQFEGLLTVAATRCADQTCRDLVRTIGERACDLFSEHEHRRWAQGQTSGADYLRLQILRDLDTLAAHLQGEAARSEARTASR
ncbi:MAG TPA: hypothetical protein VFC18_00350 [Burkholderiales bacterium]|nr:hypothetical protein [Burkholderiales bacterium]